MNRERDRLTAVRGARVVVPVTAERRELAERLSVLGAVVLEAECLAIVGALDPTAVTEAVERWCSRGYDWMAVTSRNAVAALARAASDAGLELGSVSTPVATVGDATRRACTEEGLTIGLLPTREDAGGIVHAFPEGDGKVLAPLGNLAPTLLPDGLRAKGWKVDVVEAYRTVDGPGLTTAVREALTLGTADALVLTSASVAQRVRRDIGKAALPAHVRVVVIGSTTARAATELGLPPTIVAAKPNYDGILEALAVVLEEPT